MLDKIKYAPKAITTLSYFLLLGLNLFLILGRKKAVLRQEYLNNILPEFYMHVSNFSISILLLIAIGYLWLLMGLGIKAITWLSVTILLVNIIYESFIPVLNTPDIIDAYYGIAGSITGWLYLLTVKKYGLKKIEQTQP